jgi:hypothetical protein
MRSGLPTEVPPNFNIFIFVLEYVIFFIIVSGRENKQKQLKSNTLNKIKFGLAVKLKILAKHLPEKIVQHQILN